MNTRPHDDDWNDDDLWFADRWLNPREYDNGDRAEDAESGIIRPLRSDGSRFYDDWDSDANDSETGEA